MKKILIGLLMLALPTFASELIADESNILSAHLVRTINQQLSEITAREIAAGVAPEDIQINLAHQSRFDSGRFGAIMDDKTLGKVISVTPNSPANKLGLQSADIIINVNNKVITTPNFDWVQQLQYAKHGTELTLLVNRNEQPIKLKGLLEGKYIPAWQLISASIKPSPETSIDTPVLVDLSQYAQTSSKNACGRINTNTVSARARVYVKKINNERIARGKTRHKLAPGRHVIEIQAIADHIKINKFSINIEANKFYSIEIIDGDKWFNGEQQSVLPKGYIGPAVVAIETQECEL